MRRGADGEDHSGHGIPAVDAPAVPVGFLARRGTADFGPDINM